MRHFRLDRIKRAKVTDETLRARARRSTRRPRSTAGCAPARCRPRAPRACGSRPSARAGRARRAAWSRSARDGAVVVELSFAGVDWLVREILREAGDAAVLEPEDAREAVRAAVARLREEGGRGRRLARRRPRAGDSPPMPRLPPAGDEPPRADQDGGRRGRRLPRGGAHGHLRDDRPARLAAPDAAVVRAARASRRRAGAARCGRGPTRPRRRCATSSATRARRCRSRRARTTSELRGVMLECDVAIHRELEAVRALGREIFSRYAAPRGEPPVRELPPQVARR